MAIKAFTPICGLIKGLFNFVKGCKMNFFGFNELIKKKVKGSIQTKIVTSVLALLVAGFFIYYKMVDKSLSEVNSRRNILQEKLLITQEKLMDEIASKSKENLDSKRKNLNLTNYILMEEKVFAVEASKKAASARLSTLVSNIFETFKVTMIDGNAAMAQDLIDAFALQDEILEINVWRGEEAQRGRKAFRDNYTINRVNAWSSQEIPFKTMDNVKETIMIPEGIRKQTLERAIKDGSNKKVNGEFQGEKTTFFYLTMERFDECGVCHEDDHDMRGVIEIIISKDAITKKEEKVKKALVSIKKEQENQFAEMAKTQNEEMQRIKTESVALKKEMESDKIEIEEIQAKSSRDRFVISMIFIIALIISLIVLLRKLIISPLSEAVSRVQDIAEGEGDLTKRLKITSQDEFGELAKWFNVFISKLEGIIGEILGNSKTLFESSKKISHVSNQM